MTDSTLGFLKSVYGNDPSCVLVLDKELQLIWHNGRDMPFEHDTPPAEALGLSAEHLPESGDHTFSAGGIVYDYHLTAAEDFYIISISATPAAIRSLDSELIRHTFENTLSAYRNSIRSISASAAQLNEYFEGFEDSSAPSALLNDQINMIMGSCARMLKSHFTIQELMKYYDPAETEPIVVDCGKLLEYFSRCCSDIFGPRGTTRIVFEASDVLPFRISPQRLEFFLLCVLLVLRENDNESYLLRLTADRSGNDISICFRLIPTGNEASEERLLSKNVPLYSDTPQHEMERLIISQCLKRYNGVMLESVQNGCRVISLRFPLADEGDMITLRTIEKDIWSRSLITPYHAMLSEISDFRYY